MAVSLKHTTQAVGVEAGDGEIGKNAWNEEHTLTLGTGKLLGRSAAGTGAAEEITVGSGLTLNAGTLTAAGTVGGSDTQVQFNDSSAFGGDAGLTYNKTTNALTIGAGSLNFTGSTSGTVSIQPAAAAGTYTLTLPTGTGTNGQALLTDGSGGLSWGAVGGTPGGSTTQVQFNDGGAFGGDSAWTWNKTTNTMSLAGQAALTLQTLTDGANVAWDCSSGAKAKVTLGGNRTMSAVTNAVEGTSYTLWVIQDGTGSRTLTWTTSGAGSFDFGTEGTPVLTTTASAADLLAFEAVSIGGTLKLRFCGIKRGFA